MSENIKLGYANAIDYSTLTATGVSDLLPIDNLKTTNRWQVFRANSGSQDIIGTFDTLRRIGVVALWLPYGNPTNITFDVEIINESTVVYSATKVKTSIFFSPINATSFKVTVNSSVQVDLSRLFIGNVFSPVNNLEFNFGIKYKDLSTSERTEEGSLAIQKKARYRVLTISLADILTSERAQLSEMLSYSGSQNDCYVSVFSGENGAEREDFEMIGFFEEGADLTLTQVNRWNNKLIINEM